MGIGFGSVCIMNATQTVSVSYIPLICPKCFHKSLYQVGTLNLGCAKLGFVPKILFVWCKRLSCRWAEVYYF